MPYQGDMLIPRRVFYSHICFSKIPKEMLLRMPLADSEEDQFPPADIDDGDAEGFLHLMHRRRLTALQLVGPAVPWVK